MKRSILWMTAIVMGFSACKKNDDNTPAPNPNPLPDAAAKLKDSVLLYSKDIYLWYDQIPSTFNARNYADADKIMRAIRNYSVETGFSAPVDRWSFAYKQTDWDNASNGVITDFGMNVFFMAEGDLRVRHVEEHSAAGKAGIRRGWRITKINGNTNITTSNADFIVNGVYNSNSSTFTFTLPDGSSVDKTLNAVLYQEQPVVFDSVYDVTGGKAGYMVFNSFLGDTNAIYNEFSRVFNGFASQNVKDVIIDLRYNGGGYVTVAQKLANYLINNSGNGQMMMRQEFNNKYTSFNEVTEFKKLGNLNVNRVFFIVSNNTASASELVINNLKPHMNVVLVGPSATYGKPVGYFPIPVGDWYIFPVSFRSVNKNAEGNYYNGIPTNNTSSDGLDKDWGDINEASFSSILKFLNTGNFRMQRTETYPDEKVNKGNIELDRDKFKGMVEPVRFR